MSAGEGRLRALRLVGFKSFAEKTTVEFGPGISCVIGPNGSGKSNLADALRWALGEQGRSLRTRRAEDLIFAGSSTRRAIGMADVTLVIDNRDRLLPVDFGEIELGRRLYRSGENEYLLNRQRIRLRDLVDLLDEANLADNAFLFIGQGMVDQALALRPEERRPLFEEAAGIRKHERRRRSAEAELAEAEQNLERVRDVLAELRPQARRLAAQAEQQEKRQSAASELAEALVASGRARLLDAEAETARASVEGNAARSEADNALAALRDAEEAARVLTDSLSDRADRERAQRTELDGARARSLELRLGQARLASETDAQDRERARLERDRAEAEQRRASLLRDAALPVPEMDPGLEDALRDAERALTEAVAERDGLRAGTLKEAEQRAAWIATRRAEDAALEQARARAAELRERVSASERRATEQGSSLEAVGAEVVAATEAARAAVAADEEADRELETARQAVTAAEAALADVVAREARAVADLASLDAQIASLDAALSALTDQEALRAARRRGGTLVAEGLDVDPLLRRAVEAALGDALRGIVVDRSVAVALRERRAVLVVDGMETGRGNAAAGRSSDRDRARILASAEAAGGGALTVAVRRDPGGRVTRLLERTVWVPGFEAALEIAPSLPDGWRVVTRDGELVTDEGIARVGPPPSHLETEAQLRALRADRETSAASLEELRAARADAESGRVRARTALEAARARGQATRTERRVAEEQERAVARRAEGAAREEAWNASTLDRLREQLAAAAAELDRRLRAVAESTPTDAAPGAPSAGSVDSAGLRDVRAQLEDADRRVEDLRLARDERARAHADDRGRHASAQDRRARSEIGAGLEEQRLLQFEREIGQLHQRAAELGAQREDVSTRLAAALAEEERIDRALQALVDASRDERARLTAAETAARDAREQLRHAETRSRAAEVAEMEARLRFDGARENLLVELAGIGPAAVVALIGATEDTQEPSSMEELGPALEAALSSSLDRWRIEPALEPVAGGRLAALRRRYHELGASNPFAAQEYAELRDRVATLDAQRADLETAIRNTRELIANVNALISDQFRRTFQQLEGAFARRFTQLFDGGEAQLSLTVPDDLSATGVEITARPPGKKRQPLAMLSGGERTLTAVALLLAMLEVRPVPFCVLDEVDAALDEANVGRFSSALRELAETIQFVVITHNRGTIEVADALYGVTVDDDAVSRVISMRLADLPSNGSGPRLGRDDLIPVGPAA